MGASMSAPTPINRQAPLIAREFLGAQPAAAGGAGSAAAADHLHQLGTIQRAITGFGLAQKFSSAAFLAGTNIFLVTDVGSLQAMTIWTLECWLQNVSAVQFGIGFWKQGSAASTPNPAQGPSGYFTDVPPQIGLTATAGPTFSPVANGTIGGGTGAIGAGWTHVAMDYDGVNVRFFVGGVLTSTFAASAAVPAGWLAGMGVFADNNNAGGMTIDEVRISNTVRYTASFTPPTAPFVADSATVALWHLDDTPLGPWANLWNGGGYVGPQYPNALPLPAGWAWTPNASEDASGNGNTLGLATYTSGNSTSVAAFAQIAKISAEDAISNSYSVTSLQNQRGDLELVTPAGTSAITAITPQSGGPTQLTIAAGGGGPGDPSLYIIPPVT